jgi:hypothetical protein
VEVCYTAQPQENVNVLLSLQDQGTRSCGMESAWPHRVARHICTAVSLVAFRHLSSIFEMAYLAGPTRQVGAGLDISLRSL